MVSFILSTYRNSGESIIVGLDVSAVLTARVENVGDPATTPVVSFFLPPDVRHSDLGSVRARRDAFKSVYFANILYSEMDVGHGTLYWLSSLRNGNMNADN